MALKVLSTKLQVPLPPAKALDRPRLTARLAEAFQAPVVLVAADAGFGKSTSVASFLAGAGRPAVWYRLDADDSDPAVFATYLLHALRSYVPRRAYGEAVQGLSVTADWNAAARLLSLTLHRLRRDVLIVLDDFHLPSAPTLVEGMTRLIETLPSRAHLALLTRNLPEFPLARWRAQERLREITPDDLRFTLAELRSLLVDLHGIPLSDASLQIIAARTEGWPAGVVLALHAALAQGPAGTARSLGTLSGSTRDIYDYLAQEAFTRQTPGTQRFLLATAVASRFSLPLVEALLGGATREHRAILENLERSHLFIVPLDRERRWYRYHHLFEEFLRGLAAHEDEAWIRQVHHRAADWWEKHGEEGEALHHLVASGEHECAAVLLGAHGLELVAHGHLETIRRWLTTIPADSWAAAPRLYLIRGVEETISGETRRAVRSLDEAHRRLRTAGDRAGETTALRWLVNAATWGGGIPDVAFFLGEIAEVEARLPEFPPGGRAHVLAATARIALWRGDVPGARRLFDGSMKAARESSDDYAYLWCARARTDLLTVTGRHHEATDLYEELLRLTDRRNWGHEAAHVHTELAAVLLGIGQLDEAGRHLREARLLQATIPCRVLHADVTLADARMAARRGARDRAEALFRELLGPGESATPYGLWRFDATVELCVLLADSDPTEARRLAQRAVDAGEQYGIFRSARALLAAGIVTRSATTCERAAEVFGAVESSDWQALARLHATRFTSPDAQPRAVEERTLQSLHTLDSQGWEFIVAQAAPTLLTPFKTDPGVGPHIGPSTRAATPEAPQIAIRCLGAFEVVRAGHLFGQSAWPRAAAKRLLQYLLLQDRPMHREEIIESLWPGLEPRRGANQLRVALTYLRQTLEPDRPVRSPSSLGLGSGPTLAIARDRLDLDLDHFRRALARAATSEASTQRGTLVEAIGLYRGPLYAEDPFEDWIQEHRDRLHRQYVEALARLAETEEQDGAFQTASSRWQAVVEADSTAEHAYRGTIRCYLALGRVPDALQAFESCRKALAELGAVPSPETLALRQLIPSLDQEIRP